MSFLNPFLGVNPRKRLYSSTSNSTSQTGTRRKTNFQNKMLNKKKFKKPYYKTKKPYYTKNKLRKIMAPEIKKMETYVPWQLLSVSSYFTQGIRLPPQGTSSLQRIGGKIQAVGLRVRGSTATPITQTIPGPLRVRVALLRYKNVNNQAPLAYNVVFDTTVVDFAGANIANQYNGDVKVLRDVIHEHDQIVGEIYNFDWYVKLNDVITLGDNSNSLFQDSSDYGYALYFGPSAPSISLQDGYQIQCSIQLTYIDV